jgi:hypothetical protein
MFLFSCSNPELVRAEFLSARSELRRTLFFRLVWPLNEMDTALGGMFKAGPPESVVWNSGEREREDSKGKGQKSKPHRRKQKFLRRSFGSEL